MSVSEAAPEVMRHWRRIIGPLLCAAPFMNLLLLLLGMRAWSGSPVEIITRIWCAVSLLSLEMQLATWTGLATLRTLPFLNVIVAPALFAGLRHDATRDRPGPARFRRSLWVPTAAFALFCSL